MRANLGSRARWSVLGRWKTTDVRILRPRLWVFFLTDLAALVAAALASSLAGVGWGGEKEWRWKREGEEEGER